MELKRSGGTLLHPSSLPGPYGIGDFGKHAFSFIDFLYESGQKLWQILPLGPTGYGDSPYSCFSAFAGNPLLINPDDLLDKGYLKESDLRTAPDFDDYKVDFGRVIFWKTAILHKAAGVFLKEYSGKRQNAEYKKFLEDNKYWLDDYALFMSIKKHFDNKAGNECVSNSIWHKYWDKGLALRDKGSLAEWRGSNEIQIETYKIWQYFFFKQWSEVKKYAAEKNVKIIGDIPIFIAQDSVDVWANKELFHLNPDGSPSVVSGVPPDYFSKSGQLWGNPIYNWEAMKENGFVWWRERIKHMLKQVDIIRIDHFRGMQAYWEVKAGETTAENGRWKKAKGQDLFAALKAELGDLPIIVEDLGLITKEVRDLRDKWKFPGMAVLQFAFEFDEKGNFNADNCFLPHNHVFYQTVYTGSHDNNTLSGWYFSLDDKMKDRIRRYLGRPDNDIVWEFIRMAYSSVAAYAIIPLQDLLGLDASARMNTPSTLGNNWTWRFGEEQLSDYVKGRLREMAGNYGRI